MKVVGMDTGLATYRTGTLETEVRILNSEVLKAKLKLQQIIIG